MSALLPERRAADIAAQLAASVSGDVALSAARIVEDVRRRGEVALRQYAERFDGLADGAPLALGREELEAALAALPPDDLRCLTRVAGRIRAFAEAQRAALTDLDVPIPGGRAGHTVSPVERAGCYAPGGRHPLPSSLLMTALTAQVAGVASVWVASPNASPVMLAAAALAGVEGYLVAGGAQAIAALAYGAGAVPACDVVVGPGNQWVTAAKRAVAGDVVIDALAGPSELVVVADGSSDASLVAADLLAQAEHDERAVPVLVCLDGAMASAVRAELERQLVTLPAAGVARAALAAGGVVVLPDLDAAVAACDLLAPEHLALHVAGAEAAAPRFQHYGALFVGAHAAEVLGDYGAGPNHVLPTGRAARASGGLSVLTFLRVRTWLRVDDPFEARQLAADAAWLGRVEGLEAHARSAERRLAVAAPLKEG